MTSNGPSTSGFLETRISSKFCWKVFANFDKGRNQLGKLQLQHTITLAKVSQLQKLFRKNHICLNKPARVIQASIIEKLS